ncbi:hypothetical protein VTN49DRAFT_3430 [Thermomyces lanuginosus]|uniref:uncharacterized protein n=1 Tax=Thermomyces lanuginosus TaxID=5541 RepID=UPI00374408F4
MASFVQDLWSSIFTPGPTPTLLVATNATFAALQILLFALLLATYSIHFVVLSFLSGTLWWGVNWFAKEVQEAQARAEEQRKAQHIKDEQGERQKATGVDEKTGSETETETEGVSKARRRAPRPSPQTQPVAKGPTGVLPGEGSSGYVSTDSDWEKVESERAS